MFMKFQNLKGAQTRTFSMSSGLRLLRQTGGHNLRKCSSTILLANRTKQIKPFQALLARNSSTSPTIQIQRPYVDPKYSYAFGRSQEHLIYSTVDKEFEKCVRLIPDEVMLTSYAENKQVTYKQFHQDVNRLSKNLVRKLNIAKGDSVGVFAYNCYNWMVAQYACSKVGAILTPINPSYKARELGYILKKGQVKCLFMPGPKSVQFELNNHLKVLSSSEIVESMRKGETPLESVILLDSENEYDIEDLSETAKLPPGCKIYKWAEIQDNDGVIYRSVSEAEDAGANVDQACIIDPDLVGPDDTFAIYYTSGTTGTPKGACVTQFTVMNNVRFCQIRIRVGRSKNWRLVAATCLPMFHIFAGVLNALAPIAANSHIILAGYKYDINQFANCIIEHKANTITVTPTILIDLIALVEAKKITNFPLKIVQCGGAALPAEVVTKAYKTLPNLEEFRLGYGSTENGSVSTLQNIHEPDEIRAFTTGPPLDFTEVRVVNPSTGRILPHMELGEIQTRGYNTMTEYLDEPVKTAEAITLDRWYRTGDMGFMHPHGSLQISGRMKQMIIKGGENIYPEEVRQLIHSLDYVEDAHVVGVPDKRFGEQVCAWVKLKQGYKEAMSKENRQSEKEIHKDDILDYCKKNITYFKVPKYLLFVDEFPMTPTKKVQAHVMTEKSIEILGLQGEM